MSMRDILLAKALSGGGSGGGGGVSSWNDLTDKPFYDDTVEILPEVSLAYNDEFGGAPLPSCIGLVVGEPYFVVLDGVGYDCVAFDVSAAMGPGAVGVGNLSVFGGEDNGLPFLVVESQSAGIALANCLNGSTTFSMSVKSGTIKTLDEKFLPDSVKGGGVSSWNDLTDKPFDSEIQEIELWSEHIVSVSGGMQLVMEGIPLEYGQNYTIYWDGTPYACTAYASTYSGMSITVVGDASFVGSDSLDPGKPFAIARITGQTMSAVAGSDGDHTVRIMAEREIVQPLDSKYIGFDWKPAAQPGYLDAILTNYNSKKDDTPKVSHEMVMRYKTVKVIFDGVEYICHVNNSNSSCSFGNYSITDAGREDTGEPFHFVFYPEHDGVHDAYTDNNVEHIVTIVGIEKYPALPSYVYPEVYESLILYSTESYKRFKITVNDAGVLTATQVVEETLG